MRLDKRIVAGCDAPSASAARTGCVGRGCSLRGGGLWGGGRPASRRDSRAGAAGGRCGARLVNALRSSRPGAPGRAEGARSSRRPGPRSANGGRSSRRAGGRAASRRWRSASACARVGRGCGPPARTGLRAGPACPGTAGFLSFSVAMASFSCSDWSMPGTAARTQARTVRAARCRTATGRARWCCDASHLPPARSAWAGEPARTARGRARG